MSDLQWLQLGWREFRNEYVCSGVELFWSATIDDVFDFVKTLKIVRAKNLEPIVDVEPRPDERLLVSVVGRFNEVDDVVFGQCSRMRILKRAIKIRILASGTAQKAEHVPVLRIELLDEDNVALKSGVAEIHWHREEYNVEMCHRKECRSRFVNEFVGKNGSKDQTKLAFAESFAVVGPFPRSRFVSDKDVAH